MFLHSLAVHMTYIAHALEDRAPLLLHMLRIQIVLSSVDVLLPGYRVVADGDVEY